MSNTTENTKIKHNKEEIFSASSLKLIKLLSIIMGLMIILCIIAVIYGIQKKFSEATHNFSEQSIYLKPGHVIRSVTTDAAGGFLLWIYQQDEIEQKQLIMHVDKSGKVKSQLNIKTEE